MKTRDLPKSLFLLSCAAAAFAYGFAVAHYKVFPHSIISYALTSIKQVFSEKDTMLGLRPSEFMEPARYDGSGVTRSESNEVTPSLTFLTGFFGDGNEMRLIRSDGSVVNRWRVKFFEIFPGPLRHLPEKEIPNSEWNVAVHGSNLLPDGSVVFNFTYKGTVKIDRCGKALWTIHRPTHHSIGQSSDGGFWIPSAKYIKHAPQYSRLQVPYVEDTILKVSQDGDVVKELSVLEILFKNNLQYFVYRRGVSGDLTHLNDIEELDAKTAAGFPQFKAGDLLLSMRHPSLVMVVAPETLEVKWYQAGPWIGQHDPDFMTTGRISIFSNNDDGTATGTRFGGSSIMEIDPGTRRIIVRYGGRAGEPMFTSDRGKHQRLGDSDRSILITESRAGRVLEVNSFGKVVWEYINRYDKTSVTVMTGAARYAEDYFTVTDWSCP